MGPFAAALLLSLLAGALATTDLRLACAATLVAVALGAYAYSVSYGFVAAWLLWLLVPGLRRVLDPSEGPVLLDPLSVTPIVVTAIFGFLEFWRVGLSRRAFTIASLFGAGLLVGIPAALDSTEALLFGLGSYGGALLAISVGYGDAGRGFSLATALRAALPLIALYAISQRWRLTPWDSLWVDTVDLRSIGHDTSDLRVFGTLNSPGAFAPLLAVGLICTVGLWRSSARSAVFLLVVSSALLLTFVRSAWLGLLLALLALVLAAPARRRAVLGWALAVAGLVVLIMSLTAVTGKAVESRVQTFGRLGEDTSTQARVRELRQVYPSVLSAPVGHGLGRAGQGTRLDPGAGSDPRASVTGDAFIPDSGIVSIAYQVGPGGFLLIAIALGLALFDAIRESVVTRTETAALHLAILVFLLATALAGDVFQGITGVILWYIVGRIYGTRSRQASQMGADGRPATGGELSRRGVVDGGGIGKL